MSHAPFKLMPEEELPVILDCPFCQSPSKISNQEYSFVFVFCSNRKKCSAEGPIVTFENKSYFQARKEAIEKWNQRLC